jgi:hypothetical protein
VHKIKEGKTMLRNLSRLRGFTIRAQDGDMGIVDYFYFDDESWAVRYLVANAGDWLGGRLVLLSPLALRHVDWQSRLIDVSLTKKQVENSPPIDTHKPVSRQHEALHLGYYGYPYYWAGFSDPAAVGVRREAVAEAIDAQARPQLDSADSHLRSTLEVTGYHIEASDGEIGHVKDFIVDDESWAIRYLEVDTQNWWPGKKVIVSPQWINRVSWPDSKVYVDLTRETIKNGPAWNDAIPVTREYEHRLYDYYVRSPYWAAAAHEIKTSKANV